MIDAKQLWDALRQQCCASKPFTDAKTIVMVREDDIKKVVAKLRKQTNGDDSHKRTIQTNG